MIVTLLIAASALAVALDGLAALDPQTSHRTHSDAFGGAWQSMTQSHAIRTLHRGMGWARKNAPLVCVFSVWDVLKSSRPSCQSHNEAIHACPVSSLY